MTEAKVTRPLRSGLSALLGAKFVADDDRMTKNIVVGEAGGSARVDRTAVADFLGSSRIALIGASPDRKNFASTIQRELMAHGYDIVPVNPLYETVGGSECFVHIGLVPSPVDRAIVMVPSAVTPKVVRQCIDAGVGKIWLFKGIGGDGATSPEASALCRAAGVELIDGACPLMFLEPTGIVHRLHRSIRQRRGALIASTHA